MVHPAMIILNGAIDYRGGSFRIQLLYSFTLDLAYTHSLFLATIINLKIADVGFPKDESLNQFYDILFIAVYPILDFI